MKKVNKNYRKLFDKDILFHVYLCQGNKVAYHLCYMMSVYLNEQQIYVYLFFYLILFLFYSFLS